MTELAITIETVGNPDFGQYAPVSDPVELSTDAWSSMVTAIRRHQDEWMIGGGNWTNPVLFRNGKPFGTVSYNCRVWDIGKAWDVADELDPDTGTTVADDRI